MRKIYDVIIVGSGAAAYSAADWPYKENIKNSEYIDISLEKRNSNDFYNYKIDKIIKRLKRNMIDLQIKFNINGKKDYEEIINIIKSNECFEKNMIIKIIKNKENKVYIEK